MADVDLLPASEQNRATTTCTPDMTLRDALSAMLTAGATEIAVRDDDGQVHGRVTFESVSRLLAEREWPVA